MRRLLTAVLFLAGLIPTLAFGQGITPFPQTLPPNTVVGRTGISPGPAQAIPFSLLTTNLFSSLCSTSGAFPIYNSTLGGWRCSTIGGTGSLATLNGGPLTINPTSNSLNKGFIVNQSYAGSPTGVGSLNAFNITGDNADCSGADAVTCFGLYLRHVPGGSSTKGSRSTIFVHQSPGADAATSASNRDYVGIYSQVDSNSAMPVTATPVALFGFGATVKADSGSTGLNALVGAEIGIGPNVASIPYAIGWNVVYQGSQAASTRSVAYQASSTTTVGWDYGIGFTTQNGQAALATDGTVLAALEAHTVADVLDLRNFAPTGYYFRTTPTNIDNAGQYNSTQSVVITGAATGKGFQVADSTVTGKLVTSALFTNSVAIGTESNHPLAFITNNTPVGSISNAGVWTIGVGGTLRGQLAMAGNTSGTQTWQAAATASGTITWPAGTVDFSSTGGTSQVVKQTSSGGIFTVARLACADLSDAGTGCSAASGITALTGDVTATGPGSVAATLATVNSNVGTFGSATQSVQFTVNGKGLITAAANVTVTPAVGSITGLGTGVATWLATPSSANLAAAVTGETGTDALVFANTPTLVTPAITTSATLTNNLAANTVGVGLTMQNTTAATNGNQRYSPATCYSGLGWNPTAGASRQVDWCVEVIPVQNGSNDPDGYLNFRAQTNSGGYTNRLQIANSNTGAQTVNFVGTGSTQFAMQIVGTGTAALHYVDTAQYIFGADISVPVIMRTAGAERLRIAAASSHLAPNGTAPALSSCGTTPAIVGTDVAGEVTMGTGSPTGCVITFNVAYATTPTCVVTWQATPLASQSYAVSTSAITLTQTGTSSNKVNYECKARPQSSWLLKRDLDPAANDNSPAFMENAA